MKMFFLSTIILLCVLSKAEARLAECKKVYEFHILCQDTVTVNDNVSSIITKTSIEYFNENLFETSGNTIQELINKSI